MDSEAVPSKEGGRGGGSPRAANSARDNSLVSPEGEDADIELEPPPLVWVGYLSPPTSLKARRPSLLPTTPLGGPRGPQSSTATSSSLRSILRSMRLGERGSCRISLRPLTADGTRSGGEEEEEDAGPGGSLQSLLPMMALLLLTALTLSVGCVERRR